MRKKMEETIERVTPDPATKTGSHCPRGGPYTPARIQGIDGKPCRKNLCQGRVAIDQRRRKGPCGIRHHPSGHLWRRAEAHDKILLDATGATRGIGYASVAQKLGLRVTLCLPPENASRERKKKNLGIFGCPGSFYFALLKAPTVRSKRPDACSAKTWVVFLCGPIPQRIQLARPLPKRHGRRNLYRFLPDLTHFVAALGSTGTVKRSRQTLQGTQSAIRLLALQPNTPMHGMEGWKHLETAIRAGIYDASVAPKRWK